MKNATRNASECCITTTESWAPFPNYKNSMHEHGQSTAAQARSEPRDPHNATRGGGVERGGRGKQGYPGGQEEGGGLGSVISGIVVKSSIAALGQHLERQLKLILCVIVSPPIPKPNPVPRTNTGVKAHTQSHPRIKNTKYY